jgi:hypothetical protein
MRFTQGFQSYVCPGDVITCEAGPFTVLAQIVPDDSPDAPDQRQDGFWPSLYSGAPGFIGPGRSTGGRSPGPSADPSHHRQRFAEAQAKAEAIMECWRKGEWFYCGIVLSVSLEGVQLATHAASLWGTEANYPGADNSYLTEVANELLPEAIAVARETLARLARHAAVLEGA